MSQAFQGLQKLAFLDSSDLDFKDDILNLWQQFDHMGARAVVGMALDMSPHYRSFLQQNYTKSVPWHHMTLKHIPGAIPPASLVCLARARVSTVVWCSSSWPG